MRDEAEALHAALAGTMLSGREVRGAIVHGSQEVGLEVAGSAGELPHAWEEARALVDVTGRWPLAVDALGADVYSRFYYRSPEETPQVVLSAASQLTLDEVLHAPLDPAVAAYVRSDWSRIVGYELEETARRVGAAPSEAEVQRAVPEPDRIALDRLLLDWEEARRPTSLPEVPELHQPSYEWEESPFTLAFLPTPDPAAVPAYTSFWTAEAYGHERLVVALDHWRRTYDAEPMTNTGTEMCLRVGRPPRTIQDAWRVAVELDGFSDAKDVSLRTLARATLANRRWTLIGRP